MAGRILNIFKVFLALSSFVSVFYVILEFTYFLSYLKPALQSKPGKFEQLLLITP